MQRHPAMPFLLLLLLTLVCLPDKWSAPWPTATPFDSAVLTWLTVSVVIVFARVISSTTARQLTRSPGRREPILSRYGRMRTYHVFVIIAGFAAALYGFGWGWAVQSQKVIGSGNDMLPGAELFILAPFL